MKPMIYCDKCHDWYRKSCEKLNPKDIETMEMYVCRTCQSTLKSGKEVSKTIEERNEEKEKRSTFSRNATKAIGELVELSSGLCPVMDSL